MLTVPGRQTSELEIEYGGVVTEFCLVLEIMAIHQLRKDVFLKNNQTEIRQPVKSDKDQIMSNLRWQEALPNEASKTLKSWGLESII